MKHVFTIIILYCFAYLFFLWQTPLGLEAVLDGAENILLSEQIYNGNLPSEPFYRSMLYQYFLAFWRLFGFDNSEMMFIASITGILMHIFNAFLTGYISYKLWNNKIVFYITSLIYGFYPPLIFFAAEPIDITLSITFMLIFLVFFIKGFRGEKEINFAISGVFLGLSALCRSNTLILASILPGETYITKRVPKSILMLLLLLSLGAGAGYYISEEFRLLPWQSGYNFYAANKEGANGKYYANTIYLADRPQGTNPARLESEIIYYNETQKIASDDINAFNKFWFDKFLVTVKNKPYEWLKLTGKRIYYMMNNFEQYNNKTFSFHKELSPVLKYNPLCFGFVFILFVFTVTNRRLCNKEQRRLIRIIAAGILLMGLGNSLFFASAKFRILFVPLMICVGSGAYSISLKRYRDIGLKKAIKPLCFALLAAFLAFSSYFNASDTSTYKQDKLLIAQAASRLRMFNEQVYWANETLKDDPTILSAIRIKLVGLTNLIMNSNISDEDIKIHSSQNVRFLKSNKLSFSDTNLFMLYHSIFIEVDPIEGANSFVKIPIQDYHLMLIMLIKKMTI
ncbi:MAG: hypothetical protein PHF29_01530 [Candidatus Riflebacteria bacterium]|nr:hypothetical protein [Candidatus Riflebacteria bacterium]